MESIETYHDRVRSDVFDVIPRKAGRVLDLGGGVGATGAALKAQGRADRVTLVDQVADAVAAGVDHAYAADLENMERLDGILDEAGPFDTILCLDILEHLRDPWAVIRHLHASLAPGGAIVVSLPNVNHVSLVGPLLLKGRFDLTDAGLLDRTHIRWFAKHGIIELCTSSGLTLETIRPNIFGRRNKLLDRMTFGMLTRFLALQYIVRVRRSD